MRGCALPLSKLAPPPSHFCNTINSSFPFSIAPTPSQQSSCHPHSHSHSLTIHTPKPTKKLFNFLNTQQQLLKANSESSSSAPTSVTTQQQQQQQDNDDDDEEESFQVLTAMKSDYNDIMIVDTPKSRMLLLDSTQGKELVLPAVAVTVSFRNVPRETDMSEIVVLFVADNVHSILYKEQKWTGSYWDEFASLPAIAPKGPIAILGLGGGTAAHLMLDLWPSLQLDGWEIDEILIDKARDYFGLSDLEKTTEGGGILNVHIGDVFIPTENLRGRYAGIIVDLFSDGKVLPQLQEVSTWLELHERLMPDGRFMVNCGGVEGESSSMEGITDPEISSSDETWLLNPALKALSKAFPGQLSWKRMPKESGENFMALTGPVPDLESWSASVPSPLSTNVKDWRPCGQVSRI